jgi:methyl-accepting chemotaxis protein
LGRTHREVSTPEGLGPPLAEIIQIRGTSDNDMSTTESTHDRYCRIQLKKKTKLLIYIKFAFEARILKNRVKKAIILTIIVSFIFCYIQPLVNMLSRLSIRTKLILVINLSLLVATGSLAIVAMRGSEKAIRGSVLEALLATSASSRELVSTRFQWVTDLLRSVAALNRIRGMDWDTQKATLISEAQRLEFLKLGLLTTRSEIRYADGSVNPVNADHTFLSTAWNGESSISTVLVDQSRQEAEIMLAVPVFHPERPREVMAVLVGHLPASFLSKMTNEFGMGANGYAWVADSRGNIVSHRDRNLVLQQVNFIRNAERDPTVIDLAAMIQRMVAREVGTDQYDYLNIPRLFAFGPIEGTPWSLAMGAMEKDAMEALNTAKTAIFLGCLVVLAAGIVLAMVFATAISRPIKETTAMLKDIAQGEGDLTKRLQVRGADEVGELAKWFNEFVSKVQVLIRKISEQAATLAAASEELSTTSNSIAANAEEMTVQANTVSAATEQSNANVTAVSSSAEEMSASMSVVASAVEELSSSIREVTTQCKKESEMASEASREATNTRAIMEKLGIAAKSIGTVVDVIKQIASQTNLLALNATIEAASAGEAGKGFAVVANEVKELARQTATATEDIRRQVAEMQENTSAAIGAIATIDQVITQVNSVSQSIVSSIDEQHRAVDEIARNVAGVDEGAKDVARNVSESAVALAEVARTITGVNEAANDTARGITQVNGAIDDLTRLAAEMDSVVRQFKF